MATKGTDDKGCSIYHNHSLTTRKGYTTPQSYPRKTMKDVNTHSPSSSLLFKYHTSPMNDGISQPQLGIWNLL